jgi:hypothetical protein
VIQHLALFTLLAAGTPETTRSRRVEFPYRRVACGGSPTSR